MQCNCIDVLLSDAVESFRSNIFVTFSIQFNKEILISKRTRSQPSIEKHPEHDTNLRPNMIAFSWPKNEIISFQYIPSQSGSNEANAVMIIELHYLNQADVGDQLLACATIHLKSLQCQDINQVCWSFNGLTLESDLVLSQYHNSDEQSGYLRIWDSSLNLGKSSLIVSVLKGDISEQPPLQIIDRRIWTPCLQSTETGSSFESIGDFDFYIDSIRYLPDNATIIKVKMMIN